MTDKERLEKLETKYSTLTVSSEKNGTEYTEVDVEDLVFLIQNGFKQAERVQELEQQNKRYKQALEHIQREIHKAIYTPKKQKKLFLLHISWNSDFERDFESGKTRGLIQASDIVKEAIEMLEGEK